MEEEVPRIWPDEMRKKLDVYDGVDPENLTASKPLLNITEGFNEFENPDIKKLCINIQNARDFILSHHNYFPFPGQTGAYDILTDLDARTKEITYNKIEKYQEHQKAYEKTLEIDNLRPREESPWDGGLKNKVKERYLHLKKKINLENVENIDQHQDILNQDKSFSLSRKLIRKYYYS